MHTHTCSHTHTHTHTHTLSHSHTRSHIHTLTHSHSHTCTLTDTHSHMHSHTCTHTHICTLTHTHTYIHTLTLMHTLTHTYTHTLTHTCTLTHTHTHTVLVMKRKLRSYWENNSISIWKGIPSWWKVRTGFPGGAGKESPCQCKRLRDTGSIPGLGRSPGGRHDNPLQYSHLENSVDIGTWRAILHRVTESDITETTSHTCMSVLPK